MFYVYTYIYIHPLKKDLRKKFNEKFARGSYKDGKMLLANLSNIAQKLKIPVKN